LSKLSNKLITLGNDLYIVLGTASADLGFSGEQYKKMWRLADTVLKNGANPNEYFICMKIIEAEFEDK
jgi:hypothetical protein|tara:strand:- start:200 stop:403 length:204 start_codon:yes stop_codon:yes gene_type:complete